MPSAAFSVFARQLNRSGTRNRIGRSFARSQRQWAKSITSTTVPLKRSGMKFVTFGRRVVALLISDWMMVACSGLVPMKTTRVQRRCMARVFPSANRLRCAEFPIDQPKKLLATNFHFCLSPAGLSINFNAGTMTMRTANTELRANDLLDISAEDANRLNLHNGDRVRVHSAYGEAVLPLRITSSVKPGELFATFHKAEVFLNRLTSPHRDRYVK